MTEQRDQSSERSGMERNASDVSEERKESSTSSSSEMEKKGEHGFHWLVAAIFIVGELVGGGLVALPGAFVSTGLIPGIIFIVVGAVLSCYTGMLLGLNWTMMQQRWRVYAEHCRQPYPEMAYRAIGPKMRILVSACIGLTQFGVVVVFLLLSSKNISSLLHAFFNINLNFCYLIVIIAAALLPLVMLESPKDFWQIAVIAMASTSLAIIFVFIGAAHDAPQCQPAARSQPIQISRLFLAYGTIMFAFGGHSLFPTVQHDMKQPHQFSRSMLVSYSIIVLMYLPVTIYGYVVYGDSLKDNMVQSLQLNWVQQTVNILITLHVLFTIIIILSPLSQGAEHLFNAPRGFSLRRFIIRGTIMLAATFVALSFPNFGVFLDLVGGSLSTLMSMLFPCMFYLWLKAVRVRRERNGDTLRSRATQITVLGNDDGLKSEKLPSSTSMESYDNEEDNDYATLREVIRYNSWKVLLVNLFVIVFGIIGGAAATATAVIEMAGASMPAPCYVQLFQGKLAFQESGGTVNCCGATKDIVTVFGMNSSSFCARH